MLKTINPKQTYTWSPEDAPDTVFEYKAFTGPLIHFTTDEDEALRYTVSQYLKYGIISITNITLPITDKDGNVVEMDFDKWEGTPKVDLMSVLPTSLVNKLWMKISEVTRLSNKEQRDLS